MENTNLIAAKKAFETFCAMLDEREWHYQKDEEKLTVDAVARGDDLPINLRVVVDPKCQLVLLYSPLDFTIPEEQIAETAIVLCIINDNLIDGNFDIDITTGRLCYRMSMSYRESLLSAEAYAYFIAYAIEVVDAYNDKLLMAAKGMLSPEELLGNTEDE